MSRQLFRGAAAAAVMVGVLAASSGVASATVSAAQPAKEAAANKVSAKAWSQSVCTAFGRWEKQLAKTGTLSSPPTDPAAAKNAITAFLAGAIKATNQLVKDLKSAGIPSVAHGSVIALVFVHAVQNLRDGFAKTRTAANGLPTNDPAAFATAAASLQPQIGTAGSTLNTTLNQAQSKYPAKPLDQSFRTSSAWKA